MQDGEIPLKGGNSNAEVVQVGETVRRSRGRSSDSVHHLLRHIRIQGFNKCPIYLGDDDQGRETLSYLSGCCSVSEEHWTNDSFVVSAASMLRSYHDSTVSLVEQKNMCWGYTYPDASSHEVICHNDYAPYNLISNDGKFTAVIDFDLAGPGPRLRDVAYCVYWLTPVSQRANDMKKHAFKDVAENNRRLKLFCESYDIPADKKLLDMISDVLHFMSNDSEMLKCIGKEATDRLIAEGHLEHWLGEARAFDIYRHNIEREL